MSAKIEKIYRHPLKGLTPEPLESAILTPGEAIPHDRRFAIALASTVTDGAISEWMAKTHFLMLMRDEKLAQLETSFDDGTTTLTVSRRGRQVARGDLSQAIGRTMLEDFFDAFMGNSARGGLKIVEATPGHTLSDHANPVISILNLASIRDMTRVVRQELDPRRFRGNLLIDGIEPWEEFTWVGRDIAIGDATLSVTARIDRCGATNVNPETAERDLNIPKALQMGYRHIDCGVYARVAKGGSISLGDEVVPGELTVS